MLFVFLVHQPAGETVLVHVLPELVEYIMTVVADLTPVFIIITFKLPLLISLINLNTTVISSICVRLSKECKVFIYLFIY